MSQDAGLTDQRTTNKFKNSNSNENNSNKYKYNKYNNSKRNNNNHNQNNNNNDNNNDNNNNNNNNNNDYNYDGGLEYNNNNNDAGDDVVLSRAKSSATIFHQIMTNSPLTVEQGKKNARKLIHAALKPARNAAAAASER